MSVHVYLVRCRLLSDYLTQATLHKLLSFVEKCKVCPSHPDLKMVKERKGCFYFKLKPLLLKWMTILLLFFFLQGESFMSTVQISTCELLNAKTIRCAACKEYRNSLRSIYHRWSKQKSLSPSHRESTKGKTNIRWLNTPQKAK